MRVGSPVATSRSPGRVRRVRGHLADRRKPRRDTACLGMSTSRRGVVHLAKSRRPARGGTRAASATHQILHILRWNEILRPLIGCFAFTVVSCGIMPLDHHLLRHRHLQSISRFSTTTTTAGFDRLTYHTTLYILPRIYLCRVTKELLLRIVRTNGTLTTSLTLNGSSCFGA